MKTKNKMNIVVFSRSTIAHFTSGGMETHLKNLVEGLSENGHKVTVLTTSFPTSDGTISSKTKHETIAGVDYIYIANTTPGLNPLNLWEKFFTNLGVLNRGNEGTKNYYSESFSLFKELHSKRNFDRIISQSSAAYGLIGNNTDLPPLYSVIHGTIKTEIKNRYRSLKTYKNWIRFLLLDLPNWLWELSFKNRGFFNQATKIISVNESLTKSFVNDYPELSNKIVTIYNGVDTNIFAPGNSKYPDFTILYVGRLDIEKGVDLLINSVKELKAQGLPIHLKIIGGGAHSEYLKKLASDLEILGKEVIFVGQVKNEKLAEYYQKSYLFVLPTRREEGHPMAISEAFCSGLPVICTKKGGLVDLIADGKDGKFVDDTVESISQSIKYLYENRDVLSAMADEAYSKGFKNFSKNAMIKGYINIL